MEPPESLSESELRGAKANALRRVRRMTVDDAAQASRRGRYTAGAITELDGTARPVPSYVDEPGVDPNRSTETFAELRLAIDTPRWKGTTFVLRTGKSLARRWKGVIIRFRPLAVLPFGVSPPPDELRIGLDGPETFTLHLTGTSPGPPPRLLPLKLGADLGTSDGLPAYAHVLLDFLQGNCVRAVRGDEAELGWAIVTPVLRAWAEGLVPLEEYPAGSNGPSFSVGG